jgi:hypothetical protein
LGADNWPRFWVDVVLVPGCALCPAVVPDWGAPLIRPSLPAELIEFFSLGKFSGCPGSSAAKAEEADSKLANARAIGFIFVIFDFLTEPYP